MRMKKFIFYFCLCWGVITIVGCNKDDDFDSSDNDTDVTAIDESQNQSYVLLQEVPSDCQEEANKINASLLAKIKVATRSVDGEDSYPDYYGGSFIEKDGFLTISIKGDSVSGVNRIKSLVNSSLLKFKRCVYSLQELKNIKSHLYSKYAEMSTSLKSNLTAIGISQKNNAVVVYLADCSQSRIKEFKNFYDNPAVVFTNMGKINTDNPCLSTQLVNTRSYTTLATISKFPIGAGDTCLISMSGDKPIYGTFAFRAQETSGQKRCGLVTAGHVVSVGQYCYDKDFNPFGICSSRIVSTGNAEASFIPCGYLDEFNINNYIGGSSSSVLSTTTNKPGEGTYVNKYGATTKRTGGYIQDIDCTVLSEDETATFSDMTLVKCTADGGDSGGIVYTYISKYNTRLTVGVVYGHPEKMGKNYLIYSKADNVLKALHLKRY